LKNFLDGSKGREYSWFVSLIFAVIFAGHIRIQSGVVDKRKKMCIYWNIDNLLFSFFKEDKEIKKEKGVVSRMSQRLRHLTALLFLKS
jgi:hypothetical protein